MEYYISLFNNKFHIIRYCKHETCSVTQFQINFLVDSMFAFKRHQFCFNYKNFHRVGNKSKFKIHMFWVLYFQLY
jgi:hypothetical protein